MEVNIDIDNNEGGMSGPSGENNINYGNADYNINSSSDENLSIFEKNKNLNKERIGFFTFLMNSTKGEMAFDEFQKILYWNGVLEIFLFVICFCLFISQPSQFWRNIFFILHAARGVLSLLILYYLPSTSTVIKNLEGFENESLSNILNKIFVEYKKLLINNEKKIRTLMYGYWILTIINFLMDIIIFAVLLHEWGDNDFNFRNIATLVLIVILFISNLSMLFWFGQLNYFLPPEMSGPVVRASLFESKKLVQAIGANVKKNVLSRQVGSSLRKE